MTIIFSIAYERLILNYKTISRFTIHILNQTTLIVNRFFVYICVLLEYCLGLIFIVGVGELLSTFTPREKYNSTYV